MSYYLTFGVQYKRRPPDTWDGYGEPHPIYPHFIDGNGYVRVEAPDETTAREIVINYFGKAWSFIYDHEPEAQHAPLGELGAIDANTQTLKWHEAVIA